jgi:hypothetical protein
MSVLESSARKTRLRVGLNDWLAMLGWSGLISAGLWIILIVADGLFSLNVPRAACAGLLAAISVAVSFAWAWFRRRDLLTAAALLDQAAGLKERISSGLFCSPLADPFAQATVEDAARACAGIDVRAHIRLRWPPSLSLAAAALGLAVIAAWLPIPSLLAKPAAPPAPTRELASTEVKKVQRHIDALRQQAEKNPALNELQTQLAAMKNLEAEKLEQPEQIRREAIRKIDQFADALSRQLARDQDQLEEVKRMFRSLGNTPDPRTPAEQLTQALARSDFKAGQQAVQQMREQLARMEQRGDQQQIEEMKKQLENLAGKLQQAAEQQASKEQLQEQLKKAGIDQATAQRLLKELTKKDIEQIENLLKKQGLGDKEIKELSRQCSSCKQAGQKGSDMAQAAQKAAQAMQGSSAASDAESQLQQLSEQLSSMEALDQQLGELQSMLADAQDSKNELSADDNSCSQCNGSGCSACNGSGKGGGMGGLGQGKGGRAPVEQTQVSFEKVRTPVHTTEGSIISRMFVDGEQVRGDVSSDAIELITAAEREATDAIDKGRIPNKFRGPIKEYFSEMRGDFDVPEEGAESGAAGAAEQTDKPDSK